MTGGRGRRFEIPFGKDRITPGVLAALDAHSRLLCDRVYRAHIWRVIFPRIISKRGRLTFTKV